MATIESGKRSAHPHPLPALEAALGPALAAHQVPEVEEEEDVGALMDGLDGGDGGDGGGPGGGGGVRPHPTFKEVFGPPPRPAARPPPPPPPAPAAGDGLEACGLWTPPGSP